MKLKTREKYDLKSAFKIFLILMVAGFFFASWLINDIKKDNLDFCGVTEFPDSWFPPKCENFTKIFGSWKKSYTRVFGATIVLLGFAIRMLVLIAGRKKNPQKLNKFVANLSEDVEEKKETRKRICFIRTTKKNYFIGLTIAAIYYLVYIALYYKNSEFSINEIPILFGFASSFYLYRISEFFILKGRIIDSEMIVSGYEVRGRKAWLYLLYNLLYFGLTSIPLIAEL